MKPTKKAKAASSVQKQEPPAQQKAPMLQNAELPFQMQNMQQMLPYSVTRGELAKQAALVQKPATKQKVLPAIHEKKKKMTRQRSSSLLNDEPETNQKGTAAKEKEIANNANELIKTKQTMEKKKIASKSFDLRIEKMESNEEAELSASETLSSASSTTPAKKERAKSSRFTVLRQQELGSGGFGVVYRGFDNERGEHVAVKETVIGKGNEQLVAALESEFATLVSLSHPHIVRVYLFAVESGVAQIFMEWMSSGSVSGILHQIGRRLHENVVRRYAKEALEGLAYLHGKGILHRDIKPANMLVDGNGALKLSDFGTCRAALAGTVTTTQHVVGTSAYMAPEAISRGKYSVASDIWALGCTIIETATGRMPWSHLPAEQLQPIPLMFHIGTARPPDHHPPIPEHLSAELRALLEEIFRLDPADRPTAAALLASPYFQRDELPKDAETLDVYEAASATDSDRARTSSSSNAMTTSSLKFSSAPTTGSVSIGASLNK